MLLVSLLSNYCLRFGKKKQLNSFVCEEYRAPVRFPVLFKVKMRANLASRIARN